MIFIIIGLGNPGDEYEQTRHNLGFRVIDRLCERWSGVRLRETARHCVYAQVERSGHDIVLAKPMTYMNRSGLAVVELLGIFAARPDEALVIFDDIALPTGAIRIRRSGSSGGHQGAASVIESLGTDDFPRVRLGIGPPDGEGVEHVLSSFPDEERARAEQSVGLAADAVEVLLADGIDAAMNRYNRKLREEDGTQGEGNGMREDTGSTDEGAQNRGA